MSQSPFARGWPVEAPPKSSVCRLQRFNPGAKVGADFGQFLVAPRPDVSSAPMPHAQPSVDEGALFPEIPENLVAGDAVAFPAGRKSEQQPPKLRHDTRVGPVEDIRDGERQEVVAGVGRLPAVRTDPHATELRGVQEACASGEVGSPQGGHCWSLHDQQCGGVVGDTAAPHPPSAERDGAASQRNGRTEAFGLEDKTLPPNPQTAPEPAFRPHGEVVPLGWWIVPAVGVGLVGAAVAGLTVVQTWARRR